MMKNALIRKTAAGLVVAALGLASAMAGAQELGSLQTREYVQGSASSDQFEILSADAALAQTTNLEVRAFASRMLQDHQQHGEAIRQLASKAGLKPPELAMSADQAQLLGALQSVNGKAFDTLYLKQQLLAHRSALTVEQKYAQTGDDSSLKQLAATAVPMIASHADMASQVAASLRGQ